MNLKLESLRPGLSTAEIIREALQAYLRRKPRQHPPGRGGFRSGRKDIAEHAEEFSEAFGKDHDDHSSRE